jgi:hypothetical protein
VTQQPPSTRVNLNYKKNFLAPFSRRCYEHTVNNQSPQPQPGTVPAPHQAPGLAACLDGLIGSLLLWASRLGLLRPLIGPQLDALARSLRALSDLYARFAAGDLPLPPAPRARPLPPSAAPAQPRAPRVAAPIAPAPISPVSSCALPPTARSCPGPRPDPAPRRAHRPYSRAPIAPSAPRRASARPSRAHASGLAPIRAGPARQSSLREHQRRMPHLFRYRN